MQESDGEYIYGNQGNNSLPIGHSFGGHGLQNKFTIQKIDNSLHNN